MMRIAKRDDGWWIIGIPSSEAGSDRASHCGPYRTKAEAADDRLGLERFFREHPVCETCLPGFTPRPTPPKKRASHWLIKSLEFKPPKFPRPRQFKSSPRQRMLPGFELG